MVDDLEDVRALLGDHRGDPHEGTWSVSELGTQPQVTAGRAKAELQQAIHQIRVNVAAADDRAAAVVARVNCT